MAKETRIEVGVREIDPRQLKLLDVNAHYMTHETFKRLTDNLERDGAATSTPFVWRRHDDETQQVIVEDHDERNAYLVLSGNHRVKAAVGAGLQSIHVMFTDQYLPPDRRRAIQLSHNSIVGSEDRKSVV